MIYQARIELDGNLAGMPYLEIGDQLEVMVLGKKRTAKVLDKWMAEGKPVYDTDYFGLIRAHELERVGEVERSV